jgi:hypothetical protein
VLLAGGTLVSPNPSVKHATASVFLFASTERPTPAAPRSRAAQAMWRKNYL